MIISLILLKSTGPVVTTKITETASMKLDIPEHITALITLIAIVVIFGIVGELEYRDLQAIEQVGQK